MLVELSSLSTLTEAELLDLLRLKEEGVEGYTIVDKSKNKTNLDIVQKIRELDPQVRVIPHYAISNHYDRDYSKILSSFEQYGSALQNLDIHEILLVSGSVERKFKTDTLLRELDAGQLKEFNIHVAYNPFVQDKEYERERLREKLRSERVEDVFLQLGEREFDLPLEIRARKVYGSVVYPSKTFLRNFAFRPWKGVEYSTNFLNNTNTALVKTTQILRRFKALGILPLFSSSPFNYVGIKELITMFKDA